MQGEINTFTSVLIVITLVLCVASWILVLVGYIKDRKLRKLRRHYALVLMLVLSVPVVGQTPWQPPRTPDGQPDMQGIWRNEASDPVPVALYSLEGDHARWQDELDTVLGRTPTTPPTYVVDPADGKIPYQPWALLKRQEFIANMVSPTKREHIDPNERAWLVGVPRSSHLVAPLQILQVPGYVVLLYEGNHASRVIPLDGRPHVGERIKLFQGDSRGRWEGNTLVVDVRNQDARTWLDKLSFHGEGLHVVERWTLMSPDRIDYRATFDDPTMFTQPWTIAYRFIRYKEEGYEIWEDARHEGERDVERILRGGGLAGRRKE